MSSTDKYQKTTTKVIHNHKVYGLLENRKIKPEHYRCIARSMLLLMLHKAIDEEIGELAAFKEAADELIRSDVHETETIYFLNLDREVNADIVAEWHVYDFFYAFLTINRQENRVKLIEFGLD